MLLSKLIACTSYKTISGPDAEIKSLGHNSDRITEDMLYFCLKGSVVDGHDFAHNAVAKGAVALVTERVLPLKIPQVLVNDSRAAMAEIAAQFYGKPADKMKIIGITGTNGKTTTTYIIDKIAQTAGIKTGIIGTSGIIFEGKKLPPLLTTPDPIDLHRIFADMLAAGVQWVIMEVSAHALALNKMEGIISDAAVFTNLTQDHLDYFKDMDSYKGAKTKFFDKHYAKLAIVNVDDECGREIALTADLPVYTYGVDNPADVFAIDYMGGQKGISYVINCFDDISEIRLQLMGRFNMYNSLCAAAVCKALGLSIEQITEGISKIDFVPGRFNVVCAELGYFVVVDYAHTPDGLKNVLAGIKEFCKGRIITVFGCGGNRDKTKRAPMGWIAARNSSYSIITSDNPRYEDPIDIMLDIETGVKAAQSQKYVMIENRKEAIRYALRIARQNDVVLVAGKGDENYQEIMGDKISYSDMDTVIELLGQKK